MSGKPHSLTPEQAVALRYRYKTWTENHPKRLCSEFGISRTTFQRYVREQHKGRA